MHTYTLTITKEDFLLEFKSFDKKIIEKELGIWIISAENLLNDIEESTQEAPQKEIIPEKIELGNIILDAQKPKAAPMQEDFPIAEKPKQNYKISAEAKEILQRAIHQPLPKMNEMIEEPLKTAPNPVDTTPILQKAPPVMPLQPEPVTNTTIQEPQDFASIFNQKVQQENKSTDKFIQLLSLSNIHSKLDCLIACAYHLIERESFERFTLKQINTLSKALLEESIEHDTVKEALEKRFIRIVPDYTGIATTMEYTLTQQGAEYFKDVIAED